MSDTRFTLIGIGLIFAGFIVMGIFGSDFVVSGIEAEEFEECFEYFDDRPPVKVECEVKIQDKIMFFTLIIGLIAAGIFALIRGVKGRWDQDVKPEDMLGPGNPSSSSSDKSE